jgi:hypothetical protein
MERVNVTYPTGEEITFGFPDKATADIFHAKIREEPEIIIKRLTASK